MITGTSEDYTGRQVDIALFPAIQESGVPVPAEFSTNPKAIAGLSMVVQNYGRILLTRQGTYRSDPQMGTKFFDQVVSRGVRYPSDLQHIFLIESGKVLDYLANHYGNAPLDERISSA